MPIYAYQCASCHHAFDVRQSFSEDALTECPQCHEPALRKKFSTVGVSFRGTGFYSTDSKSSAATSSGDSTGGTSSGSAS